MGTRNGARGESPVDTPPPRSEEPDTLSLSLWVPRAGTVEAVPLTRWYSPPGVQKVMGRRTDAAQPGCECRSEVDPNVAPQHEGGSEGV
ncbi:unnamed protein product [Arctogadus glacialis]